MDPEAAWLKGRLSLLREVRLEHSCMLKSHHTEYCLIEIIIETLEYDFSDPVSSSFYDFVLRLRVRMMPFVMILQTISVYFKGYWINLP